MFGGITGAPSQVDFLLVGQIRNQRTFATGGRIRELRRLIRCHGFGKWRKRKGVASVQLPDGSIREAELHWYEASGIGRKEIKIKRFLD